MHVGIKYVDFVVTYDITQLTLYSTHYTVYVMNHIVSIKLVMYDITYIEVDSNCMMWKESNMNNTELSKVREYITNLLEQNKQDVKDYSEKIATANGIIEDASTRLIKAKENTDVKEFHKVQDEIRAAKDSIVMYSEKMEAIKSGALISQSEYEEKAAEILAIQEKAEIEVEKQLIAKFEEIQPLAEQLAMVINDGNDLLYTLQTKCYKDPKVINNGSCGQYYIRKYTNYNAVGIITDLVRSDFYKNIKKKHEGRK